MGDAWDSLVPKLQELNDLNSTVRLLHWDQAVLMPARGGAARARVVATVESEAHRRLTDHQIGDLIAELEGDSGLDDTQRASLRVLKRDVERATRLPDELVRALAETSGVAYQAWTEARPRADFELLEPHLTRLVDLKRQEADALGWREERYDALLDQWEPGMTTAEVRRMLDQLVEGLKPIQQRALASERKQPEFLFTAYDEARQESFCRWLVERIGFNFDAGRLDTSPHPFTSRVGRGDIRQTIRTDPRNPLSAIYAALHETGHALYELGIPEDLLDAPAGRAPSLGMHESQSRLWENQVGRSRAFTDFLLPHLKEVFPEEIGMATPEEFYWAVNHAGPSLIRVEADELTYNLHIAVRFELEVALMREELEVADLPGAFDERMESHLGLRPPDDSVGVLQDMHWAVGTFGYFPTYTVGNLYAAALYAAARADLDALESDLRAGETTRLLGWLRTRVHQQAYLRDAKDLMATLVGDAFDARPLLGYLAEKYAGD